MSTLKSPPPQAFSVSDVHPRLRKCPPGCTLDCGFKTSESPALRGFEAERGPIRGTSLYLAFIERPSPLEKTSCKVRFFAQNHSHKYRQKVAVTTLSPTVPHCVFQLLAQTAPVCFHGRKRVHARLSEKDRTQRLTRRNRGRFGRGWHLYPQTVLRVSETLRGQMSERQTLPFWGLGRGHSRRTQRACGTAMRSCASLFRGVAAPQGRVIPLFFSHRIDRLHGFDRP